MMERWGNPSDDDNDAVIDTCLKGDTKSVQLIRFICMKLQN